MTRIIKLSKRSSFITPIILALFFASCKQSVGQEQLAQEISVVDTAFVASEEIEMEEVVLEVEIVDTTKRTKAIKKMKPALIITVTKLKSLTAPVVMGVYGTKNNFLDEKDQLKEYTFKPVNGKLVAKITDLPYGVYGIALYQDLNSDGEINKSIIGIPKEPYAFSNNIKPKFKAPSFDDCKFTYSETKSAIRISLL